MAADSHGKGAEKPLAKRSEEKLLDVLGKEVENRRAEILLRKEDSQNRKEAAMHMLDVQAKALEHHRNAQGKESTKQKFFVGFIFFVSILSIFGLIRLGQEQLAEKLITLVVGLVGGYGYAMRKSGSGSNRSDE
ncbi:MAG: hypothetical protein MPJ22_03735 [Pirellulales bacterium]|nr:hypothetical protein [Pirellulales bacterium]